MRRFYEENLQDLSRPEAVEASHILVKVPPEGPAEAKDEARRRIQTILERLETGEEFSALARTYSDDASAENGGSIGTVYRGSTTPAFDAVLFALGEGTVSDVIESEHGLHLLRVSRKIPAGPPPFDEIRDQIHQGLMQRRSREAIEALVDSLRARARIEIL
jgi:peptidyl-prolyl cis-trans isomerase C